MRSWLVVLLLSGASPALAAPPPTQRLGAMVTYSPLAGDAGTWGVWAGPLWGHRLFTDALWGYLGVGYLTVRDDLRDAGEAVSPLLGLELHTDVLADDLELLGRAVVTFDRTIGNVTAGPVPLQGVTVSGQLGVRYVVVELFLSAGLGPGEGAGVGVGAAFTLPMDRERPAVPPPPSARLY